MPSNIMQKMVSATDSNQKPLRTFREGAVAASVWSRQSAAGSEYLDFSVSRSWKTKTGDKEGYSQNFYENNELAVQKVVTDACNFIRSVQPEHTFSDVRPVSNGGELETE